MDVNGSRYHLLLGDADWASCLEDGEPLGERWGTAESSFEWDATRAEILLRRKVYQFVAAPQDSPSTIEQRRGSARDQFGNWYWIDDTAHIVLVKSRGSGTLSNFWPPPTEAPQSPPQPGAFGAADVTPAVPPPTFCGLTITDDHRLVVGIQPASGLPGLLLFDLFSGGPPEQICWPQETAFSPFDLAARPGGGVVILDKVHRRFWTLDRTFRVMQWHLKVVPGDSAARGEFEADSSAPVSEGPSIVPPEVAHSSSGTVTIEGVPIYADDGTPWEPIAIEALPNDLALILDRPTDPDTFFGRIHCFGQGTLTGEPCSLDAMLSHIEEVRQGEFSLIPHDFAVQSGTEAELPRIFVASQQGNQAFLFELEAAPDGQEGYTLTPDAGYFPMRRFAGRGLVSYQQEVSYDFQSTWVPLTELKRPRFASSGTLCRQFDSGLHDCQWHRVMLDGSIPGEARLTLYTRCSNDESVLSTIPWSAEPVPYRRSDGSELPYVALPGGRTYGCWETLLQRAQGRYLEVRLTLAGSGRASPRIRSLRVWYPRFSYLERYLPPLYREEALSASFLDRFLANCEGFFTTLEDRIAAAQLLFDARTCPPETLEWLASWFGIALDPTWDESRRRLFIRYAMTFFQCRGTVRGIQLALHLTLDETVDETLFAPDRDRMPSGIRIVEGFRTRGAWHWRGRLSQRSRGLRVTEPTTRWNPEQGTVVLRNRYRQALKAAGFNKRPATLPTRPPSVEKEKVWRSFVEDYLGFVPTVAPAAPDTDSWQGFLSRRYRRISALNEAWSTQYTAFSEILIPRIVPRDGAHQVDWYQFEAIVQTIRRGAHRFTVVLPASDRHRRKSEWYQERLRLAERLIELEKPAHTTFEVKFYWSMLRVGHARLERDTALPQGSDAPELMPPMVLGQEYLAESYVAPSSPKDVSDRTILGCDSVES